MKTLQVDIPEKIADEIEALVQSGWFSSPDELVAQAIRDFADRNRLQLAERYQMDDIEWAKEQRNPS